MWTAVASMSISRDAVGVCLLGDKLYAVGGYDGQTYLNIVEAYDPQTNEWTQVCYLIVSLLSYCENNSSDKTLSTLSNIDMSHTCVGLGERTQLVRSFAAIAEDPTQVWLPTWRLTTSSNSRSSGPDALFWILWELHT